MEVNLSLNVDELNFLMNVLGELPTKSNAWLLVQKIKGQAEPQVAAQQPAEAPKVS